MRIRTTRKTRKTTSTLTNMTTETDGTTDLAGMAGLLPGMMVGTVGAGAPMAGAVTMGAGRGQVSPLFALGRCTIHLTWSILQLCQTRPSIRGPSTMSRGGSDR